MVRDILYNRSGGVSLWNPDSALSGGSPPTPEHVSLEQVSRTLRNATGIAGAEAVSFQRSGARIQLTVSAPDGIDPERLLVPLDLPDPPGYQQVVRGVNYGPFALTAPRFVGDKPIERTKDVSGGKEPPEDVLPDYVARSITAAVEESGIGPNESGTLIEGGVYTATGETREEHNWSRARQTVVNNVRLIMDAHNWGDRWRVARQSTSSGVPLTPDDWQFFSSREAAVAEYERLLGIIQQGDSAATAPAPTSTSQGKAAAKSGGAESQPVDPQQPSERQRGAVAPDVEPPEIQANPPPTTTSPRSGDPVSVTQTGDGGGGSSGSGGDGGSGLLIIGAALALGAGLYLTS